VEKYGNRRQEMEYPTPKQIQEADRIQVARWWRYLPTPGANHTSNPNFIMLTQYESELMNMINKRFEEFGGMTPELSKIIGWKR